jgi:hypothetical protein
MWTVGGQVPILVVSHEEGTQYELALFDDNRAPVSSAGGGVCSSLNASIRLTHVTEPFSFAGIKKLTRQGAEQRARKAIEELDSAGVKLTVPQEGKPFSLAFERPGWPQIKVPAEPAAGAEDQAYILHCWASW